VRKEVGVTLSNIELEILIYESAARSQEQRVIRAYRSMKVAKENLMEEERIYKEMQTTLQTVRNHYLSGVV
jgi:outer membrane protein TolC